jgi:hypothetical protein
LDERGPARLARHFGDVAGPPYAKRFAAGFSGVTALCEHGAALAELGCFGAFGLALGEPKIGGHRIAAVCAQALTCQVDQGAGEAFGLGGSPDLLSILEA